MKLEILYFTLLSNELFVSKSTNIIAIIGCWQLLYLMLLIWMSINVAPSQLLHRTAGADHQNITADIICYLLPASEMRTRELSSRQDFPLQTLTAINIENIEILRRKYEFDIFPIFANKCFIINSIFFISLHSSSTTRSINLSARREVRENLFFM